ncbi:hypothetical protein Pcac1_g26278 [Phytophthora cactorum]|nr:hypothetical protein Pcac1_g26278 [Phytophthora cactorum]
MLRQPLRLSVETTGFVRSKDAPVCSRKGYNEIDCYARQLRPPMRSAAQLLARPTWRREGGAARRKENTACQLVM